MLNIRRAEEKDIPRVLELLGQVLEVHAAVRPDLFISGTRKYTAGELREILRDENRPVFVAEDEEGYVAGYCFCILQAVRSANLREHLSLYIDDLCVDEKARGRKVGKLLCDYAEAFAREKGCGWVTLNVWAGNEPAEAFYRRMGFTPRKTVLEKRL